MRPSRPKSTAGRCGWSWTQMRQLALQFRNRRQPTSTELPRLTACCMPIATRLGDNMTQWYYADAQRQRQGPVDTDTLRARLTQGIIDRSSLVWREGLAQWVALHEVGAELGLDSAASAAPGSARSTPADALIDAPLPAAYPGGSASATAPPAATSPLHDHVPETSPWQPAAAGGGIVTASASDAAATDRTNHHPAVDLPATPATRTGSNIGCVGVVHRTSRHGDHAADVRSKPGQDRGRDIATGLHPGSCDHATSRRLGRSGLRRARGKRRAAGRAGGLRRPVAARGRQHSG